MVYTDDHNVAKNNCEHCEKSFTTKQRLKTHILLQHEKVPWVCEVCSQPYESEVKKNSHEKSSHPEVKCEQCDRIFRKNSKSLRIHIKREHMKITYDCEHCKKSFTTKQRLKTHILLQHEKVSWICEVCSQPYESEDKKNSHEKSSHPDVKCEHCDRIFRKNSKRLRIHIKREHMKVTYDCDVCEKAFLSKGNLKQHKDIVHSEVKVNECDICGLKMSTSVALKYHKETVHDQIRDNCKICGKSYERKNLYSHMYSVHGEKIPCEQCGKNIRKAGMKEHISRVHSDVKNWPCDDCGKKFGTKKNLKRHHDAVHLKLKETCEFCGMALVKACLKNHILKFHKGEKIVCKHCGRPFKNHPDLGSHIDNLHKDVKCELCDKMFKKGSIKFRSHVKNEHSENPRCDTCGKTYGTQSGLNRHIIDAHSGKEWICDMCGKKLSSESVLRDHKKGHFGKSRDQILKNYKCDQCDISFYRPSALKIHKDDVHTNKTFKCEHCDKIYNSHNGINTHLREKHSSYAKALVCDICGKSFPVKNRLNRHIRNVHENESESHKCDVCEKVFKTKSSFNLHFNHAHKENPIRKCEICEKTFYTKHDYSQHMSYHSETFPCDTCEKTYNSRLALESHKVKCLDIKKYKCDICGVAYRLEYQFKRHQIGAHTDSGWIACSYCDKLYRSVQGLNNHRKICTMAKESCCKPCGITFKAFQSFKYHKNIVHKEEI